MSERNGEASEHDERMKAFVRESIQLGKFEGCYSHSLAEWFYDQIGEGFASDETGNVHENGRYYAIVRLDETDNITLDGQKIVGVILIENASGFVDCLTYDDNETLDKDWLDCVGEVSDYYDSLEDES